jgi:hypothetical protein
MPEAEGLIGRRDCRVKLFCHREMLWSAVQQVRSAIDGICDGCPAMTNSRREHRQAAEAPSPINRILRDAWQRSRAEGVGE